MLKKFFNRLIVITILGSQLSTFSYAAPKDFDANKLDLPSSKTVMRRRHWTAEEDKMLVSLVESSAPNTDWKFVASNIKNHNVRSCKERYKCISNIWTPSDDKLLMDLVDKFGFDKKIISDNIKNHPIWACRNRYKIIRERRDQLMISDFSSDDQMCIEDEMNMDVFVPLFSDEEIKTLFEVK